MNRSNRALRVAFLLNFIPPYRIPVFRALQQRIDDLHFFLSTPMEKNRSWTAEWGELNVTVLKSFTIQKTWRHPYGFSEPNYIHLPYNTIPLLSKLKPDVIVSSQLGLPTIQALLYRKLHRKSRLIVWATLSEHLEQGRGRARESLRSVLLPRIDAVLVNGESGARYIRKFGYPGSRIYRVPQTIDTARFTQAPIATQSDRTPHLLYVGRLIELKNISAFVQTLNRWGADHPDRNVVMSFVGDGPERQNVQAMTLEPNIHMHFLGEVPYSQIQEAYSNGDIFVLPTLADEWGLVVNEAMAAGMPILGSLHSQAVEELVSEGKTGWLFHPNRPESIYQAIERALSTTPERILAMKNASRARVNTLTPDYMAECMADAIYGTWNTK